MSTDNLEQYLNDHLAGSAGALVILKDLAERETGEQDRGFFEILHEEVRSDQEILRELLESLKLDESTMLQAAGKLSARLGRWKLLWSGLEPGDLGIFEALEMLSLGIEGKRLLWIALGTSAPSYPAWNSVDFTELERRARDQRDRVEERRLRAAGEALAGG